MFIAPKTIYYIKKVILSRPTPLFQLDYKKYMKTGKNNTEHSDLPSGEGIFDELLEGGDVFKDREVLQHSYVPKKLPHRDGEVEALASLLVPALRGETPSNIIVYGKTGTGKTASAKLVAGELEEAGNKHGIPCQVEYINCERVDTNYRVLARLAHGFGREDVPETGWPTDRVYDVFFEAVDSKERVVVVMLDEIDRLVEKDGDGVLYNLSRMNSELNKARISVIGISNDVRFTRHLDPRVKSSLGEEEVVFSPYDARQLQDILEQRAEKAFKDNVLDVAVVPLCSAFAASEHGDARKALDLLRTAGELSERSGSSKVEEKHVRKAKEKIEVDRTVEVVDGLPTQSKAILHSIILLSQAKKSEKNEEDMETGEVYRTYKKICNKSNIEVLTQRRVVDLIDELDMLGLVSSVVVSKGRYGRTREISPSLPKKEAKEAVLSDPAIEPMDISFQSRL